MRRRVTWLAGALLLVTGCSSSGTATTTTQAPPTTSATATTTTLPPGVIAVLDVDHRPSGIIVAGEVLWTEDHAQTRQVSAVDPETGATLADFLVSRPCDVAATDGRIWVADLELGKLVWIDATTREVGGEVSPLAGPCGLQVVDGAVWFVVDNGLGRMDPETEEVTITDLGGGAFPGSGTPLWAAMFDGGDLLRIDTATGEVTLTIEHPGGPTEAPVVAAGFGALWVAGSGNTVYRLDPVSGELIAEVDATTHATRLLVTAGGVWLTSFESGVVVRIDPTTNQVVFRAELGGNPNGIAEGLGSIWVTDTLRGFIFRLDPAAEGVGA